jgi:hypothetical protein
MRNQRLVETNPPKSPFAKGDFPRSLVMKLESWLFKRDIPCHQDSPPFRIKGGRGDFMVALRITHEVG